MAILKQNGVTGKVIRAQGTGKVLKQNYNFGDGLDLVDQTLTLEGLNLQKMTLGLWNKVIETSLTVNNANWVEIFLYDSDLNSLQLVSRSNNLGTNYQVVFNNQNDVSPLGITTAQANTYALLNIGVDIALKEVYFFRNSGRLTLPYTETMGSVTKIVIKSSILNSRIDDVFVYNRLIDQAEIHYKFNNLLSNNLLNVQGLINSTKCGLAEIYNFSDGDDVAMHNELATESFRVTGLPAGTLKDQVDYVNDNLIVRW